MTELPQSILSILEAHYGRKLTITGLRNNGTCTAFNVSGMNVEVVTWTANHFRHCTIMQGDNYYGTAIGTTLEEALQFALSALDEQIARYTYRFI